MTTAPPIKSPWGVPARIPPLGLAYIAANLEKEGFKVKILDNYHLDMSLSEVKKEIANLKPDIIGITCSSVTYQRCIETVRAAKEVAPYCKIVVGGPHPSYMPESMLQHPEIDYLIIGEGEKAMTELVKSLTNGEDQRVIARIRGVACRYKEKIIKNRPNIIDDLDQIPLPARHLLQMDIYDRRIGYLKAGPADVVNVIRGCPYNCSYCESKKLWGSKCRLFSPPRIIEELECLINKYGSKGVYFIGDNFTINKKHTLELCDLIKQHGLDIEWACDTRVDLISRDLLRKMRSAGCRTIFFGVQSGSPKILEKLNMNLAVEQFIEGFKLCKEEGIQIACSFLLGIPGEKIEDMEATFKFAKTLDPDWCQFNVFIACPGSTLYDEVLQKGLYSKMEGFLAYVKTDEFDYEMVVKLQKIYQRSFYISPRRIFRRIRREGLASVLKKGLKATV